MDLRKYAKGKPCMIRLPGCIDSPSHETTVLCHWRDSSTGIGQKEEDIAAAHGCMSCHDAVDFRKPLKYYLDNGLASGEQVKVAFLEGIIRTQKELVKSGIIKW